MDAKCLFQGWGSKKPRLHAVRWGKGVRWSIAERARSNKRASRWWRWRREETDVDAQEPGATEGQCEGVRRSEWGAFYLKPQDKHSSQSDSQMAPWCYYIHNTAIHIDTVWKPLGQRPYKPEGVYNKWSSPRAEWWSEVSNSFSFKGHIQSNLISCGPDY